MKSYSQVNQDLWVLEMLHGKEAGFFIDVGAYDGVEFSNTYLLETEFNWGGLCVEAHPLTFSTLQKNRRCICANFAVTDFCGKTNFDSSQSLSSKISNSSGGYNVDAIDFIQLFSIFNVPPIIDYMSLDIEGNESKALSRFPFETHVCRLITVEHNLYLGDASNKLKIKSILTSNKYKVYRENVENNSFIFEDWYIYDDSN